MQETHTSTSDISSSPTSSRHHPYPYQREAIDLGHERNLFLADECGLGKTLVAVEIAKEYTGPRLVVVPGRVKEQWLEEILRQHPTTTVYMSWAAGRMGDDAWEDIREGRDCWIITHWESLLYIGGYLADHHWSVVIADEAHRAKNRNTKRTIWLKMIKADKKIALTGTPMQAHPDDLWSVLNWLYPHEFRSYWKFVQQYCEMKPNAWTQWDIVGPKNLDKLAAELEPFYLQRTKHEVAPQLPPKIVSYVPVLMTGQQLEAYERLRKSRDIEVKLPADDKGELMELTIPTVLAKIVRMQQISSDPELLDYTTPSAKLEWLMDYILDNPDEVIVIFTKFRMVAQKLARVFKCDLIIGGIKSPLQSIAGWLGGDAGHRILVGTIAAMGEGLNLQRASTAIFVDQEWSSIKMQQAIDRIHRIDITEPKQIIYLYSKASVDVLVLQALQNKWTEAELVKQYLTKWS